MYINHFHPIANAVHVIKKKQSVKMSEKKISFGFKQVKKQPLLLPTKIGDDKEKKNDIELIQCLEGQTIKLINEKEEKKPLIIPLLNSQKTSTALASLRNLKTVLNDEDQLDDAGSTQGMFTL